MDQLVTAAQMQAIEIAAINSGDVSGLTLMERAGAGVVEAIFEEWPEFADRVVAAEAPADGTGFAGGSGHGSGYLKNIEDPLRAAVLCGPGNNGGDGFVVARLLHDQGWAVEVFLFGRAETLPPDARANYERWLERGAVAPLEAFASRGNWGCDLVVDALFGTGLKRHLKPLAALFWQMEDMVACFDIEPGHALGRPAIVAVDVPSGICSDSGREFPHEDDHHRFSASAHLTVSFQYAKPGHFLACGPNRCGKVVVKDIGLRGQARRPELAQLVNGVDPSWMRKHPDDHKFRHGHALVVTGGLGATGAARLAARGALRIGAGLVTLGVPQPALAEIASQITALMMRPVDGARDLAELLKDERMRALCLGPGLGVERARDLVPVALESARATVLDADALSAYSDDPDALFGQLHGRCILTPHHGEFARLFPDLAEMLRLPPTKGPAYSKVDAACAAAARAGCTVVFKGPATVIAHADGRCNIHAAAYARSAPWLATAGSGDVLAGFITGLLARNAPQGIVAESAVWLHSECALAFGPGLVAEDLPEMLPALLGILGV